MREDTIPPPGLKATDTAPGIRYMREVWGIPAMGKKPKANVQPTTSIYAVPENPTQIPRRSMPRRHDH